MSTDEETKRKMGQIYRNLCLGWQAHKKKMTPDEQALLWNTILQLREVLEEIGAIKVIPPDDEWPKDLEEFWPSLL